MKFNNLFTHLLLLLTCGPLLFSCNSAIQGVGRKTLTDQQYSIKKIGSEATIWQTEDLAIQYKLVDAVNTLTISGTVQIGDRVRSAFPVYRDLNIYIYQLNGEGVATSRHVVRPNLSYNNSSQKDTPFTRQMAKDVDVVSIAFSYWGTFSENAFSADDGDMEWEIFYSPFEK